MNYYCNPMNLEYRYQFFKLGTNGGLLDQMHIDQDTGLSEGHREAADPSLIVFKGKYYLFPSVTAGFFTSENLLDWEFHKFVSPLPLYDYAPDVRVAGDYLYFSASSMVKNCSFFRTKDPETEPFEEIPGTFPFWDPNLFVDDDGRFYFYWGCSNVTPIYGVELDPDTMKPLDAPLELIHFNDKDRGYERSGEDHIPPKTQAQVDADVAALMAARPELAQISEEHKRLLFASMGNDPYLEGAWMTKHEGKYYLQYAIPGTQRNVYNDGVYMGEGPLGPFTPAKNNPYSYKPGGFITGAGHGSTLEDKNGRIWHTASMRISKNHSFERRLGLWKAGFDKDGELYCDQRYGDWPVAMEAGPWEKPEWMLLSYKKPVSASSGTSAEYAVDENIRTWWRAADTKPGQWIQVDLGEAKAVHAVQINFADQDLRKVWPKGTEFFFDMQNYRYMDEYKQPTQWILEGSTDGEHYEVLVDKSQVDTDYSHDFIVWEEGIHVRYIRLTIIHLPYGQIPCVSGLRVFGKGNAPQPQPVRNVQIRLDGALDMDVSWEDGAVSGAQNATGYNILWGYEADKLYHSCMVFGQTSRRIGALVKDEPVYVRVDAFNETGIAEGTVEKVR